MLSNLMFYLYTLYRRRIFEKQVQEEPWSKCDNAFSVSFSNMKRASATAFVGNPISLNAVNPFANS